MKCQVIRTILQDQVSVEMEHFDLECFAEVCFQHGHPFPSEFVHFEQHPRVFHYTVHVIFKDVNGDRETQPVVM